MTEQGSVAPLTPEHFMQELVTELEEEIRLRVTHETVRRALMEVSHGTPCFFQLLTKVPRHLDFETISESVGLVPYLRTVTDPGNYNWMLGWHYNNTRCFFVRLTVETKQSK